MNKPRPRAPGKPRLAACKVMRDSVGLFRHVVAAILHLGVSSSLHHHRTRRCRLRRGARDRPRRRRGCSRGCRLARRRSCRRTRPGGGRSTRCARPWRPSRAASACSAPRRPRPGAPGPAPHRQHSRVRIARPRSGPGRSPARLGPRPPRCRGAGSGSGSGSIERKISSFLATNRSRCDGAPCRAQGCRCRRSPRRMCCRCCYSPSRRSSSSRRLIPPRTLPAITDADETEDLALFRRAVLLFTAPASTASAAHLAKNRSRGGRKHLCLPPAMCFSSPCLRPHCRRALCSCERRGEPRGVLCGQAGRGTPHLPAESAMRRRGDLRVETAGRVF